MAEMIKIPIEEKVTLTLGEAASYSGIGMNKLTKLLMSFITPHIYYKVGRSRSEYKGYTGIVWTYKVRCNS